MALPIKPPFPPMEALSVDEIPAGAEWQYEPKWDGFRCLAFRDGKEIMLQSKSGQPLIDSERLESTKGSYASPMGANGKVYIACRNGDTLVLKQSDKLEMLAINRLDEQFDASPALASKELFLRGHEYLYCIVEKEAAH